MKRIRFAPGKIILAGEYAVVFGYPGLAIPSELGISATFESGADPLKIVWEGIYAEDPWMKYLRTIVHLCEKEDAKTRGTLQIESSLPLGKGMGSSTALVIAVTRALLGENCHDAAKRIEDTVNPGHSGIDFAVIWDNRPLLFERGKTPTYAGLSSLPSPVFIDTGSPNERTPELVAWVKSREDKLHGALETIGGCAKRLINGEDPLLVLKDHHRAQVELGVVPKAVQELIAAIEKEGGAAKVIGAGGRTGGGGMVLVFELSEEATKEIVGPIPVIPV